MNTNEEVEMLQWEGSLDISRARHCKESLLEAFDSFQNITVDLTLAEEIDIAIIQLLYAAHKEAQSRGIRFTVTGKVSPGCYRNIELSGFLCDPLNEESKAWCAIQKG
ncbi:MAG TPA: STAS domain-containing protein [Termitinemataceae bacterium]|nr:STAS domain-containing protein [Termitinemataceae bacterium]HOM23453.1 STAS domain-containing protein [Termitinemataceae bacterium]HPQ00562.1 STAS domain-containing protein [Termitinemataceae bacterium]